MRSGIMVCSLVFIAALLLTSLGSVFLYSATPSLVVGLAGGSSFSNAAEFTQIRFGGDGVTIIRDEFGIPHIDGSSQQAVFFGFGYAQAEDAIETIMLNYLTATGTLSKTFGPFGNNNTWYPGLKNVESDVLLRMLWVVADEEDYRTLSENIRRVMIEPFTAGINYYIYTHWDTLPSWIKENAPVTPLHVCSMAKLINLLFSRGALEEWIAAEKAIKSMGVEEYLKRYQSGIGTSSASSLAVCGDVLGSNQWAVNGSRTSTGFPMYGMNPHLPWDGVLQWYQAHLMAPAHDGLPELNVMGAIFYGLPFIGMGHNRYIAWSETVNQVDVGDVWIERLNDDNTMYYYNGAWRPLDQKTITVPVKISGVGVIYQKIPVYYTHHGVLLTINTTHHWALAVNYSTSKNIVGLEQWYRINTARNLEEFKEAWSLLGTAIFNVMYADVYGNIFYVWNGVCPRRNDTFNWKAAVPGWLPETDWGPVIPFGELPQQENPESGWMQNCNIPAWNITIQPNNVSIRHEATPFPSYLVGWDGNKGMSRYTRGYMLYNMLLSDTNVTIDDMIEMAVNVSVAYLASDCISKLPDTVPGGRQELNDAIKALKAWDMKMTNQTAATIFQLWAQKLMDKCREKYSENATIWDFENYIGNLTQEEAVETLNETVSYMLHVYGNVSVYWYNVHYVVRGQYRVGLSGTSGEPFGCLNPRWYTFNEKTGEWRCTGGSSFIMVVSLEPNNIKSWSVLPYGVSNKPSSPHYADQLLNYYSKDQLHPNYFYMVDILAHNESSIDLPVYSLNETIEMIKSKVAEEMLASIQVLAMLNIAALHTVNQAARSSLATGLTATAILAVVTAISARRKPKTPA
ncbi:MAG: penicillin acylase family protein [Candidatus Jordarchaeales archaeon]